MHRRVFGRSGQDEVVIQLWVSDVIRTASSRRSPLRKGEKRDLITDLESQFFIFLFVFK